MDWGGAFEFDAVSDDLTIVAVISTSRLKTRTGKLGSGKCQKIRADIAFLYNARCKVPLAVFTEACMHGWAFREQQNGRLPPSIELVLVEIDEESRLALEASREIAAREVSPKRDA